MEDEEIEKPKKKLTKLDEKVRFARMYLEKTNELVDDIKDNTNKQKVDLIINSERLRQEQENQEKEEIQDEKQKMKN